MNAFSGTDPSEKVIGDVFSKTATTELQIMPSNAYDAVAHLIPDHTEVTEDFLGVIVRNAIIGNTEFL